jgi:phospholipid/cholesterol/gamma-HCH transport system substrate-binding protein
MQKQAPTVGRLLTMVVFALSCFGLLLFLWLAFGGPIPLKPKGYRVQVAVAEANQLAIEADVRSSGVSVGKIRAKTKAGRGNKTIVDIELDREFAPLCEDARVIMRSKTILGERFLEITRGSRGCRTIPEGGRLADARVAETTELDEVLGILDPTTRQLFRTWQQETGAAVRERGMDLNDTFGNLPQFAASGTDVLKVLDQQEANVQRLVRNTGATFEALSRNEAQLRNLVVNTDDVFEATSRTKEALAETFEIFPTFLDESRSTANTLNSFSREARPVVRDLRPAISDLRPALRDARRLAPDLKEFVRELDPLITVSKEGLPALRDTLKGIQPLLGQLQPFLEELNPILQWIEFHQRTTADFMVSGGGALVDTVQPNRTEAERGHYLGQFGLTGPQSAVLSPSRSATDRGNAYLSPDMLEGPKVSDTLIFPSWDCSHTGRGEFTTQKGGTSDDPSCWVQKLPGLTRFPHIQKADYSK